MQGRSFVISVSGFLRAADIPADTPYRASFVRDESEIISNGGSCIACMHWWFIFVLVFVTHNEMCSAPSGGWLRAPVVDSEAMVTAELDHAVVRGARQNFDYSGHYARPDVLSLRVSRARQTSVAFSDGSERRQQLQREQRLDANDIDEDEHVIRAKL